MDDRWKEAWIRELSKPNSTSRERLLDSYLRETECDVSEVGALLEVTAAHMATAKWKLLSFKTRVTKTVTAHEVAPTLQCVVQELLSQAINRGRPDVVELLLQRHGANVNKFSSHGRIPLWEAVRKGKAGCAKVLLEAGADVNQCDQQGGTLLLFALGRPDTECVKQLLKAGADANQTDERKCPPLWLAAVKDHTECVKLLLDAGAHVNQAMWDGKTPLVSAVLGNNASCTKALLEAGADVNSSHALSAAAKSQDPECVKLLLQAGANVNQPSGTGRAPLMEATSENAVCCMKLLLQAGADVNSADEQGRTSLWIAVLKGRSECVKMVMEAGADVNKADDVGQTVLWKAAQGGYTDCMKLLLEAGADVNISDHAGTTPLSTAAGMAKEECVSLLLEAGALLNVTDSRMATAISTAVCGGHVSIVKMLLEAGADANQTHAGLYAAVRSQNMECVKLLLEAGADVNKTNALSVAVHNHNIECVKMLLEAGADANKIDSARTLPLSIAAATAQKHWASLMKPLGPQVKLVNSDRLELMKLLKEAGTKVNRTYALSVATDNQDVERMKLLLDAGSNVNKCKKNLLKCVLTWEVHYIIVTSAVKVLLAAGVRVKMPKKYFQEIHPDLKTILSPLLAAAGLQHAAPTEAGEAVSWEGKLDLKNQCRQLIRDYLMTLDSNTNLFKQIGQFRRTDERAGLPEELISYLLYNQSLDVDWDEYNKLWEEEIRKRRAAATEEYNRRMYAKFSAWRSIDNKHLNLPWAH